MSDETLKKIAREILSELPLVADYNGGRQHYLFNTLRAIRDACAKIAEAKK